MDDAIAGPHEACRKGGFSGLESHVLELFPRMSSGDVSDKGVEVIGKLAEGAYDSCHEWADSFKFCQEVQKGVGYLDPTRKSNQFLTESFNRVIFFF